MRLRTAMLALTLGAPSALAGPLPSPDAVFAEPDMASVQLGWLLFYDPILSGNREVACATCHHPDFGTSDGVSLGIGDGGVGIGQDRRAMVGENAPEQRIPRNSPALFNLGAAEFDRLFHDGRLEADPERPGGIRTPLGADMVAGFESVLSAQAMFPVLSPDEMAGHYSENDVAKAVRLGLLAQPGGAWDIIAARVEAVPGYRSLFDQVIGRDNPIRFTDIANAMADFIAVEWRADDSAFDRHLRGETSLTGATLRGMELFYGDAGCDSCHSGQFQTDHGFHAIAMPQIGPGKAARFESHHRDTGRMRVTGDPDDAYAFRTPSLRNVLHTAPYGHAGAYNELEDVIRHHTNPVGALSDYDAASAVLPPFPGSPDSAVLSDAGEMAAIIAAAAPRTPSLSDAEIIDLIAFLGALTDTRSIAGRLGIPKDVPSGLPVPQ